MDTWPGDTALALLWRTFCFAAFYLLIRINFIYHRSLPMASISLCDLISHDLYLSYAATMFFMYTIGSLEAAGGGLPPLVACAIDYLFHTSISALFLYLSAMVMVQFIHCYRRVTSVTETVTDIDMQFGVRAAVLMLSNALQTTMLYFGGETHLYNVMVHLKDRREHSLAKGFSVVSVGLIAIILNVVLRIYMFVEKRKTNVILSSLESHSWYAEARRRLLCHLMVSLALVAPLGVTVVLTDSEMAPRNATYATFMIAVPFKIIVCQPKLRQFAWGLLRRFLRCPLHNKISPIMA